MTKKNEFKDMKICQKGIEIGKDIYKMTKKFKNWEYRKYKKFN